MEPITLIGAGPLGTALGVLLARANWPIEGIASRSHGSALTASLRIGCSAYPDPAEPARRSRFVLLALPPAALAEVCGQLAAALREDTVVAHTCGSLGPEVLGLPLGLALHPLQSVPDPEAGVELLPGSLFTLEGPAPAVARGSALVRAVGGIPRAVSGLDRDRYQGAVTLATTALSRLLRRCLAELSAAGLENPESGLGPVVRGTLENVLKGRAAEG